MKKNFVLDTNVLLYDPNALLLLAQNALNSKDAWDA